jgi:4-hydroxy-L-threonine phosphate dehydrogenase PdxA
MMAGPRSTGTPATRDGGRPSGAPPLIGITMGDPAGIGPEVIVKALADPALRGRGRFVIFGFHELLAYAADQAEINPYWFRVPHEDIDGIRSGVVVADFDDLPAPGLSARQATPEGGVASLRFLDAAIAAHQAKRIDAIVTGPIHKMSWKYAGEQSPGHTEYLADAYRSRRVTMAFAGGRLRVALASTHVGLFELRNQFTIGKVFQPIDLLDDWLRRYWDIPEPRIAVCGLNPHAGEEGRFGDEERRIIEPAMVMAGELGRYWDIPEPRIAVCGLNPHAGEEGRFGDEERRIIEPAMVMAGELGIQVEGPFPADTLFVKAAQGHFDGVVAMYHDQGLIPIKLLHFDSSVNVTLGLPVIRTSVDHGTAFDIAGRNLANPGSMRAALELACRMAEAPVVPPLTRRPMPKSTDAQGDVRAASKTSSGHPKPCASRFWAIIPWGCGRWRLWPSAPRSWPWWPIRPIRRTGFAMSRYLHSRSRAV